ncbi:Hydroquinone glucosyltransferase [Camellia lanceoleosa]|uniref:Hydroquinone glucosyltransferase n=1 Tax=Camellia lanceoleosa TaxID=1840588 RepID=A0ACC0HVU5_9ERIC|nr:Hydroquinone glucosyltransferase [Camellia lanceoleosa]
MSLITRLCVITEHSLRPLRSILIGLNRPKALIIDIFSTQAFAVCHELSIPVYSFFTAPTTSLTFSLYLPTLDREVKGEFIDLPEPVSWLTLAAGILVNTWNDLEPVSLCALRENPFFREIKTPPVHPIEPLVKEDESVSESDKEVFAWLDNQPSGSILFVALGSGGTLTSEQLTELALGLEMSQHRFVLVARKPIDTSASMTCFNVGPTDLDNPAACLPEGFVKRMEGVGLAVPLWAPQVAVLCHGATGGFLSHCGWNSTLESIVHGLTMIAWPLYAKQRMNASILEKEVGVAVKPVADEGKRVIGREEVDRVVRLVMEGEEGKIMRCRARELQDCAWKALSFGYDERVTTAESERAMVE